MTRSKKKAGPSTRRQPIQRRARQAVRRSSAPSTSLRRVTGRSSPPPAQDRSSDELPTLPKGFSVAVLPESGHSTSPTERPVARTLVSDTDADADIDVDVESEADAGSLAPPSVAREKASSPSWLLALAAIVFGSIIWVVLGNSGSKSSKSDVSAGKPDTQLSEPATVAAAPPVAEPAPPPEEQAQVVIDLDEPATPKPTTTRRVLSAKAAPKAEVQAPTRAAIAPFDPGAAESALTTAAEQASSCRQAGDPTGVAKVVVTFAPSGRVTSATISGPPFAGTQTGSCIAKTMRGMSLPAFEGQRTTISKTVVIM